MTATLAEAAPRQIILIDCDGFVSVYVVRAWLGDDGVEAMTIEPARPDLS